MSTVKLTSAVTDSGALRIPEGRRLSSGEIERMLLEARRLVETAVDRHRNEERLLTALESEEGVDAAERHIESAERTVAVVLSGRNDQATARLLARLGRANARGVDVRVLGRISLLENPSLLTLLDKYAPGVAVRLVRVPLQEMVLVDGLVSVVWSRVEGPWHEASLVRAPAVLRNQRTLFMASWSLSAALEDHRRLSGRTRSAVARRILLALSSGRTDEVAARELGVSVRTYRRNVAEITRELGANSRFQAGARAMELGLLPLGATSPLDNVPPDDSA
uniref:Regulatory protein A n=1 Tax=Streptomyces viridochromogenes TaxID=1938 RepID=G0WV68_STRVR|nr:regulatory protein A [Streptomyces viridochromogenes]